LSNNGKKAEVTFMMSQETMVRVEGMMLVEDCTMAEVIGCAMDEYSVSLSRQRSHMVIMAVDEVHMQRAFSQYVAAAVNHFYEGHRGEYAEGAARLRESYM
jgi:hypothetical protein